MRRSVLFFQSQQILFEGLKSILRPKLHTLIFHEPAYLSAVEKLQAEGWKVLVFTGFSNEDLAFRLKNRSLLIPFPEKRSGLVSLIRKANTRRVLTGTKPLMSEHAESFKKDLAQRSSTALDASIERLRTDCSVLIDEEAYEDEELIMGGLCTAKPKLTSFSKPRPYSPKKQKLVFPYTQRITSERSLQIKKALDARLDPQETIEVTLPQSVGRKSPIALDSIEFAPLEKVKIPGGRSSEEEAKGKE
jgi:hypothetical protein